MSVSEEERDLLVLNAQFVVKDLQIFPEVGLIVAPAQGDLKDFTAGREGGQSGQTLLATATCRQTTKVKDEHNLK